VLDAEHNLHRQSSSTASAPAWYLGAIIATWQCCGTSLHAGRVPSVFSLSCSGQNECHATMVVCYRRSALHAARPRSAAGMHAAGAALTW
jgi:hypothetical protein